MCCTCRLRQPLVARAIFGLRTRGLEFLSDKAKSFSQQRDSSKLKELDVEDLLTRGKPDIVVQVFRCLLPDASVNLEVGSALILKVDSEVHVSVLGRFDERGNNSRQRRPTRLQ